MTESFREESILQERIKLIISAGANVIFTTRGLDDLGAKFLIEAGAMGVRRVETSDLKHIAEATGGQIILTLADLEGAESFDVSLLGEAESVAQERVASNELIIIRGLKLFRALV
jgi:T-complex protein 1 subunit alpha